MCGRFEPAPAGHAYVAFAEMSGGVPDSAVLAIAHLQHDHATLEGMFGLSAMTQHCDGFVAGAPPTGFSGLSPDVPGSRLGSELVAVTMSPAITPPN